MEIGEVNERDAQSEEGGEGDLATESRGGSGAPARR